MASNAQLNGARQRPLLTTEDLLAWLKISRPTLYKLIALDGLPCIRLGHHTARYDHQMIERWLLDRAAQGDVPTGWEYDSEKPRRRHEKA
jgi:predicted DNA-binding transcriptional regulator AlpA